jgi:drug/metabolite transporter (DMT)-like permease
VSAAAGLALAGVSALASSSSHALLKSGSDKLAMNALTQLTAMLVALPFIALVGFPEPALWPWLIGGWVLHTFYYLTLIWSYSSSDYSAAFPIARGIPPIMTAILGVLWLGDRLDLATIAGVVIICGGIFLLSFNRGMTGSGLLAAGLAGLINSAFTLIDAKGMRTAIDPLNFLVWYYVIDGISMPLLFMVRRKGSLLASMKTYIRPGVASGIFALFAFLPTLIAFRLAPIGAVSAVRATSVLFSLVLGGQLLKERLDGKRIGGAILITMGALTIIGRAAFF